MTGTAPVVRPSTPTADPTLPELVGFRRGRGRARSARGGGGLCGDRRSGRHLGERVHAVVVPVSGATVTLDELHDFCAERIAGYKIPRSLELVEALPLSAAGKVLKRELRTAHWAGKERPVR